MEKIYKQLMTTLESVGVKPIEAVGQEFNPDFHNAVMHVEDDEFGENIIAEEFQKGYMYRESVVRHSMVKVETNLIFNKIQRLDRGGNLSWEKLLVLTLVQQTAV